MSTENKIEIEIQLVLDEESQIDYLASCLNATLIDPYITQGNTMFDFLMFDETKVRQNIWRMALVRIENVTLLIPYSIDLIDDEYAWIFNPNSKRGFRLLKRKAIAIAFNWILYQVLESENPFAKIFKDTYGYNNLCNLASKLKYGIYGDSTIRDAAFHILD
jgi:hypothetical protein